MKITLVLTLTGYMFLVSCVSIKQPEFSIERAPFFNKNEFTGLKSLGHDISSVRLDYTLDSVDSKELHFNSCIKVNAVNKVQTDQYHLLRLIKANCIAVGYYFDALKIGTVPSFLPENLNEDFIRDLPAKAVPNLGGQSLKQQGILAQAKDIKVLSTNDTSTELSVGDNLVVNYHIIARGDFNNDGIEDMLLRLDWHISSAFGKGYNLLMITKTNKKTKPSIIFRW